VGVIILEREREGASSASGLLRERERARLALLCLNGYARAGARPRGQCCESSSWNVQFSC